MNQTIHTIQDLVGVGVATTFLGWALWRLAILFGVISNKQTKGKASPKQARTEKKQVNGGRTPPTGKKRGAGTLSRQALYSARKHLE